MICVRFEIWIVRIRYHGAKGFQAGDVAGRVEKGVCVVLLPSLYRGGRSCGKRICWRKRGSDGIVAFGFMGFGSAVDSSTVPRSVAFGFMLLEFFVRMCMARLDRVKRPGWIARCHGKGVSMVLSDVYSPIHGFGSCGTSIGWRRGSYRWYVCRSDCRST